MRYSLKELTIEEKTIEVTKFSKQELKKSLTKCPVKENTLTIVKLIFSKTKKLLEKNLLAELNGENNALSVFADGEENGYRVVTLVGDFQDKEVVMYQELLKKLAEEKKEAFESTLKEVKEKSEKIDIQNNLVKKSLDLPTVNKRITSRSLDVLLDESLNKQDYLTGCYFKNRTDLDSDVFFQRDLVWSIEKKQNLIMSLLKEIPIGNFYINKNDLYEGVEDTYAKGIFLSREKLKENSVLYNVLYDGKQRIDAVKSYLLGEFSVRINDDDYYFGNLPFEYQHRITDASISVVETNFLTKEELINYYITINEGQEKHTEEEIALAKSFIE